MTIALTGHRPPKMGLTYELDSPGNNQLSQELDKILIEYEPNRIISGMALGADQIWAIAGLHRNIRVVAAIPFIGQETAWPEESQWMYSQILKHKKVTPAYICEPGYAAWKMQRRNEWMVDHCSFIIAVWNNSPGGTANCVKYAQKRGKKIIRIDIN